MAKTGDNSRTALIDGLNALLADHVALWFKTKHFHWHVTGPRFRELHLLFDEQAAQVQGQIDIVAERVRKLDAATLTSLGAVQKASRIADQDEITLSPDEMVRELLADNTALVEQLKALKEHADKAGDNATDGLLDDWTDMAEERVWFLKSILA